MKAVKSTSSAFYIHIEASTLEQGKPVNLPGSDITPRGVSVCCDEKQIAQLHHNPEENTQAKYPTLFLSMELGFADAEVIQLETQAQVKSIRRVSQQQFEVFMAFDNMMQDGYRHIARYIVARDEQQT